MSMFVNSSFLYVLDSHSRHLVRITPIPTKLSLTKFGGGEAVSTFSGGKPFFSVPLTELASTVFIRLLVLPFCWLFFLDFLSSREGGFESCLGRSGAILTSWRWVMRVTRSS